jgi:hypothetical protein
LVVVGVVSLVLVFSFASIETHAPKGNVPMELT